MRTLDAHSNDTELQARDRAAAALLYLGQKIRALYARPSTGRSEALSAESTAELLETIESELIPRLMLAHEVPAEKAAGTKEHAEGPTEQDHARLLDSVLRGTAASTRDLVDELLERGVPRESLFVDVLGRCARSLGELWEEDRCDFADVTIGLCRLHEALREYGALEDGTRSHSGEEAPSVLLATACGDQHVFGVVMVADFFRRADWRVWAEPGASCDELAGMLARNRFDLLGLSAACDALPEEITAEIEALRKASSNSSLRVLVGGRLFVEQPDLVVVVGADGMAGDAREAAQVGRSLIATDGAVRT